MKGEGSCLAWNGWGRPSAMTRGLCVLAVEDRIVGFVDEESHDAF